MCGVASGGVELQVVPVEWAVTYPVNPHDPIGSIRAARDGFHAQLESEPLGVYPSGDAAVEAVWERYLERARVEHDIASRTHGSDECSGRLPVR